MPTRTPELGDAELEVLKVLWEHGALTVREVMNRLHGAGRELAYTTVLTFLTRLEQKGVVASNKSGVAYVYRSRISKERVTRSRLKTLIDQLFDGAPGPLLLQLMQSERFSEGELGQLRRLLDELDDEAPQQRERDRKGTA